jgi:hypothetical protein
LSRIGLITLENNAFVVVLCCYTSRSLLLLLLFLFGLLSSSLTINLSFLLICLKNEAFYESVRCTTHVAFVDLIEVSGAAVGTSPGHHGLLEQLKVR